MNSLLQTTGVILSFLYDFELLEGENTFSADIDFILNGKRKIGVGKVHIAFAEADSHAVLTISHTGWNEAYLPVVLDSRLYTFNYIPGIALQVDGTHKNPFIGKFKVSIFPKNESRI